MTAFSDNQPVAIDEPLADAAYRAAVVDLLAVLAYGELSAFERLCDDAALAPSLSDKAEISEMAVAEFGHFQLLRQRLVDLEVDPEQAMQP
ncbi:MAG: ferritin-like fold-containing protein, partial [Candidatus Nanopelagicales bacterium]